MNIAIVDDLPSDLNSLSSMLSDYASIHHLRFEIKCFSSGEELLSAYQPLLFSILFLDIYLGRQSGTEIARQIRSYDEDVPIVFTTTSDEHRAEAFDCFATAYLTKPVTRENVFRVMDHVLHFKTSQEQNNFFFIYERREHSLPFSEIISFHSEKNYVILRDLSGNEYKIRMLFSEVENLCQKDRRFLTISRGVTVNLDHVLSISREMCQLKQNICYPVSIRKSHQIQQMWYNYTFEKLRNEA